MEKACSKCLTTKPLSEFHKNKNTSDGYQSYCSLCRKSSREERIEYERERGRQRYAANKDEWYRRKLLNDYSLTLEDYNQMAANQNNVCLLCESVSTDGRRLAVDHDHVTGKVRGLLCNNCNRAIGLLRDDPNLLRKAAAYVEMEGKLNVSA